MEVPMNKTEFLKALAEKAELSGKQANSALNAFVSIVEEELKKGEKIQLVGFGTFELKDKPEREGINPATGAKVKIPASKNPTFKMGKAFKELFN